MARNTVQYKEQELDNLAKEKMTIEEKLKNSNTEKLHNEILELNIANSRVSIQRSTQYHCVHAGDTYCIVIISATYSFIYFWSRSHEQLTVALCLLIKSPNVVSLMSTKKYIQYARGFQLPSDHHIAGSSSSNIIE